MNHDLKTGVLVECQICNSKDLDLVIDLGHQPPCDSLLTKPQLDEPEKTYPLRFLFCKKCGLAQIDYVVEPEVLFFPEYPYRTGITETLVNNLQSGASKVIKKFNIPEKSLIVDIGSNDGTFLKGFQLNGMNVLGVEPTNIADIANKDGINTIKTFFSEKVAESILEEVGKAHVVTAANMFAHIPNLGDLIRGVERLLVDEGVFITESHYLLDLIETNQYDSIYHEHLKFYSLKSLVILMEHYGFTVTDAERIPNYGGSIRVYSTKGKNVPVSSRLEELLEMEEQRELFSEKTYLDFKNRILKSKYDLQRLILNILEKGETIVGLGCPGRSSTLLNFCEITPDMLPYIAEQSTSLKLNMFLPGKHIPVIEEKELFKNMPDYVLMLSWHYAEPIIKKMKAKGMTSKVILPLPSVRIID